MDVIRGCSANQMYISEDYFIVSAATYRISQLETALKYCKHSKKKHQIKKKLKIWRNLLDQNK